MNFVSPDECKFYISHCFIFLFTGFLFACYWIHCFKAGMDYCVEYFQLLKFLYLFF
jgi:hypothetical protein